MTDDEFDLLDELYFVQPYDVLKKELDWEEEKLLINLQSLYEKGWIKCLISPDEEIFDGCDIMNNGTDYFYLATKKGLMQHNAL